ncbi:DHH family phosphoesterase [Catalinimonas niigatensis]|uniref:DHH family phosphoesterase n=1 Tax=Catalinimonas niigatensis TaxID=1397264 RepID=UPI002664E3DF|nr:bifunctional oligoribonuclease/PAP phosphatase NrnA [Catalinimonas niigatensis]WPP48397.1 bifunctional oligoribonuclease/PAP phosphatase NrnA [Catalinimonas niigatensis]
MQDIISFKKILDKPKRIVIVPHVNPDADALGSCLGLASVLKKKGHEVKVISPTDYPEFLHWMKGNDEVMIYNAGNEKAGKDIIDQAEIIFCLDFCALKRADKMEEPIRNAAATKVLIDHHHGKEDFADFECWNTKAAATCELIYQLVVDMDERQLIDKHVAEALYAGVMTDTGSFRHPNTTKHVHEVVAELIDLGADVSKVSKLVYDNNSLNRLRFIGFALSERLEILKEYNTAYFAISAEDLSKFSSRTGDTEGLVNYALSIVGVTMAAIIIEREDAVKLSFRSVGDFPVNELAAKHFEGGGHKNAAGGISHVGIKETVQKFLELLPEYKKQLHKNQKKQELYLT